MPELPDVTLYIEALEQRIRGQPLERVRLASAFLLRTVDPPIAAAEGRRVRCFRRLGKRIAIGLEGDLWLVLHLMINGRLHWKACRSAPTPRRRWEPGKGPNPSPTRGPGQARGRQQGNQASELDD